MIKYYLSEIIRRFQKQIFDQLVKKILDKPPVKISTHGPLVLSMVHQRDVLPYLAAVKSFAHHVDISGVIIIADKTISAEDKEIFKTHIPNVIIYNAIEFVRDGMPSGGCWERLIAISNHTASNYVIQLDADTLTTSTPEVVIECISKNISFTLGTFDLISKVNVTEVSRWAQSHCLHNKNPHIQLTCESNLIFAAADDESKAYIRGCAGFAGFAPGSICEEDIRVLSQRMMTKLGDTWSKWGTEQFASNYLVSNSEPSRALPHPVYTTPDLINHTTCFVHFIGPLRYKNGKYTHHLNLVLEELNTKS